LIENLKLRLRVEGAVVRSLEKIRLPVLSLFFVFLYLYFIVLIAFAALYSPVEAVSRPAGRGNSAVVPAK